LYAARLPEVPVTASSHPLLASGFFALAATILIGRKSLHQHEKAEG
jgi:hypothetical protein